jgi:hypothetical protein
MVRRSSRMTSIVVIILTDEVIREVDISGTIDRHDIED